MQTYAEGLLMFNVGEHVFLKVSPLKGSLRFGEKGKLTPRYIGPFEILQRIGPVAYHLALPPPFKASMMYFICQIYDGIYHILNT